MTIFKRLGKYLRPYLGRLTAATVSMGLVAALNALRLWMIKPLQDRVFIAHDVSMLRTLIWGLPVLSVLLGFFSYLQNYWMVTLGLRVATDIRREMFEHLQSLSMDFFTASSSGEVTAYFTNDLTAVQNVIVRTPIYLVRDGLTAVGNIALIFYLNWRLALWTITLLPFCGWIIARLGKILRRVSHKGQEQMGDLYSVIQENQLAAPVVKAYTAESQELGRFDRSNLRFLDLNIHLARTDTIGSPLMEMIGTLLLSFLLWKGGTDVIHGVWTAGSFLAFMAYAIMTYRPLKNFSDLNAQLQLGLASAERIFKLLDKKPSIVEVASPVTLSEFSRTIGYENVSFHYPSQRPESENETEGTEKRWALREASLTVRRGEVVALVGSSGAGKSTLAILLPRFYDPISGRVTLDGHNIREATLPSLRRQIGVVTQEVLLFNETVRYNIAYGKPDASPAAIEAAAEAANAHLFIRRLPAGYDTVIGERGMLLSGGERQRLSIARALLKNPPILILDEATSALDAESERLVQNALERLMAHRTAIVIAHRLSTVRRADRIFVFESGRIIEEGDHATLLSRQGTYHKLHNLQILH